MLLPADDPTAQMDKRGAPPAVRNPYSWMAEGEVRTMEIYSIGAHPLTTIHVFFCHFPFLA
jgi:hypothetical protein